MVFENINLPSSIFKYTVLSRPRSSFIVGNTISNFTTSHPDFGSEINLNQRCRERRQEAGFSIHLRLRIVRKNCLALWPIRFPFQSTTCTILYLLPLPLPPVIAATASPVAAVTIPLMIYRFTVLPYCHPACPVESRMAINRDDAALPAAVAAPCC